jgi:peptidoglycan/LPS O-acetylase OafA/YrhL
VIPSIGTGAFGRSDNAFAGPLMMAVTNDLLSLRYKTLDHWRGVAALMVVMFHGLGAIRGSDLWMHPSIAWIYWLSDFGWFGVHLFFVISGYCIAANLCRQWQVEGVTFGFLWDRLLRIYPTYWAACIASVGVALAAMPFNRTTLRHNLPAGPLEATTNLLLLEPYLGVPSFLLVSWSLVYELGFYALAAIGFALARTGVRVPWILFGGVLLAFLGLLGPWTGPFLILNFWPEFFSGVMVFFAIRSRSRGDVAGRLIILLPAAFALVGVFALPDDHRAGQLIGAAAFALLLFAVHPFDAKMASVRGWSWLGWVGTFSYSLYLIHVPVESRFLHMAGRWVGHDQPAQVFLLVLGWLVAVAAAWCFYKVCEEPLEHWRHRRHTRARVKSVAKASPMTSLTRV